MKNFSIILFLIFFYNSFSQWSITSKNFPVKNFSYERYYCSTSYIGNSGANQIFDFSNAFIWNFDTLNYLDPAVTPFYSLFLNSTVATYTAGNISKYNYYNNDSNAYWGNGMVLIGDFGNGVDTLYGFQNSNYTDTIISNDYTYGHSETELSKINIQVSAGVNVILTEIKNISVDAYGTLKTPFNYFDSTLRVKRIIYKYDSIFVNSSLNSVNLDTLYEYCFYVPEVKGEVIIIHTDKFDNVQYLEIIKNNKMINGCTDPNAQNYNPIANIDDGSCYYCQSLNLTVSNDTSICKGDSVTLFAQSNKADLFIWSTGDTNNFITLVPDSSSIFSVYAKDSLNCWETKNIYVNVNFPVKSFFWIDNQNPDINDTIKFINLSENANSFFWDFGDDINGDTSFVKNPLYKYNSPGKKQVMLIAKNICYIDTFFNDLFVNTFINENIPKNLSLIIYPNPGKINEINIIVKNKLNVNNIRICIYNTMGTNIICDEYYTTTLTNLKLNSIMGKLSKGMYFLELQAGGIILRKKFIVE